MNSHHIASYTSRHRAARRIRAILLWMLFYSTVAFLLFLFVFPILWTFMTSIKNEVDAFAMPPRWVFTPTWENYQNIFRDQPFLRYIGNSVLISTASTFIALAVGTPAAYALSRFTFRGKHQIALYILTTRVAPPALLLFPFFLIYRQLGIIGSHLGLVLVYLTFNISFVVWLLQSFFDDVPVELDEAALIDGCSRWQAFLRIVLPLTRSGLSATAIFCIMMTWNEFLYALVLTNNDSKTLPVAITSFIQFTGTRWGELTAAATVVMAPILLFSFFAQRKLARGLTMGAVK